jgi:hypothetical protein
LTATVMMLAERWYLGRAVQADDPEGGVPSDCDAVARQRLTVRPHGVDYRAMEAGDKNLRWLRVAKWVLGIGLVVGAAVLCWDWQASLAPTPIRDCSTERGQHTRFVHITTTDGDVIRAAVARCPAGKTISKRRGELVYRVDGAPLGTTFDALFGRLLAGFALVVLFLLIGNLRTRAQAGPKLDS